MAFRNQSCEIRLGNVESRLLGTCPAGLLDAELNPPASARMDWATEEIATIPSVFDPGAQTFLTGALPLVKRVLRRAGVRYRIRDHRETHPRIHDWTLRNAELRDYQVEVVDRAIAAERGLLDLGTGAGKTVLAAAITARLGLPTLILVTTRALLEQTRRAFHTFLGVEVGLIGDGLCDARPLTIGLVQSFHTGRLPDNHWRNGLLIFDEGHHAAALTYQQVVRRISPRYHYYLSAVPFRPGPDQKVLDALAGSPLTGGQYSARFLIDHGYACPVEVSFEHCPIEGSMGEKTFSTLYREFIVGNRSRNLRIVEIAADAASNGQSVLILVDHVAHGKELVRLAAAARPSWPFAHGSTPRTRLRAHLARFAQGEESVLVATSALLHEGISIDGIEVLIQAGGLKSKSKIIQSVGRGMRTAPGKKACRYYDFYDDDPFGVFRSHSNQRVRTLREQGFHVPPVGRTRPIHTHSSPGQAGFTWTDTKADQLEPAWHHIPGTRNFTLVRADGEVLARAECLRKELVPASICKKCKEKRACKEGGRITWLGDSDRTSCP